MEIRTVSDYPALSVRLTIPFAELQQSIGEVYSDIAAYLEEIKSAPAGYPFVIYYSMEFDHLDVEIGFPAVPSTPGKGRIKASVLPGGRFLHMVHTGPYAALEQSYKTAEAYLRKEGLITQQWVYEQYYNFPEDTPEAQLRTGLFFPLAGS